MKRLCSVLLTGVLAYAGTSAAPLLMSVAQAQASGTEASKPRVRRTQTLRPQIYQKLDEVRALADEKKFSEAQDRLDALEKIRRNSYEQAMTHNMAAYLAFNKEDYASAIKAYEQVIAIENIPESLEQTTLYSLAKLQMMQENYKAALSMLNKWFAVVEKPSAEAYILRAQMQFQLEQYGKALPDVKKAIALTKEQGAAAERKLVVAGACGVLPEQRLQQSGALPARPGYAVSEITILGTIGCGLQRS